MRLALPSLIIFLYAITSMVIFTNLRPALKISLIILLFIISLKYIIYVKVGGSFIAPNFPPYLLIVMETLYSALIMLVFMAVIKDLIALVLLLSRLAGTDWHMPFSKEIINSCILAGALLFGIYGTYQSMKVPEIKTTEVEIENLPQNLNGFSIIQLTDIHIGLILDKKWLEKVVEKTNSANPDLIVVTGDMIDGRVEKLEQEVSPLSRLYSKNGVLGVTGNHEYYFNFKKWVPVFEKMGIEMLDNEHRVIDINGSKLIIAGVPDTYQKRFTGKGPDFLKAVKNAPEGVSVLLSHRPDGVPINTNADLQLSGHTHGGHIFFLKWLIGSYNGGLVNGLYQINKRKIYVSPGTGLWAGFSCRIGVPSEITRIVLKSKDR